jgi:hypothetical protein
MPVEYRNVDSPMTRFNQSFINLTSKNSTLYPATTAVRINTSINPALTAYEIYDQWAFRVVSLSATQS